jgi:hypothetical protein
MITPVNVFKIVSVEVKRTLSVGMLALINMKEQDLINRYQTQA